MNELDNLQAPALLLRRPSHDYRGIDWHQNLFAGDGAGTTHQLLNANVTVTIVEDAIGGAYLSGFTRRGGSHTWTNACRDIWAALIFDCSQTDPNSYRMLHPVAEAFSTSGVQTNAQGDQHIVLTWEDLLVEDSDTITVSVRITLAHDADFFTVTLEEATWGVGTSRFAVDQLTLLPLRVDPLNSPDDFAALGCGTGVLSANPIRRLKFDYDENPLNPKVPFAGSRRAAFIYPSGRGMRMPVWGYYENTGHEGWHAWIENQTGDMMTCQFQSDGARMLLAVSVWQPGMLSVGNGAEDLAIDHTLCVRPFLATTDHGWWDIANHYRDRMEETQPYFWSSLRADDSTRDELEKVPSTFVQVVQEGYTAGPHRVLVDRLQQLRDKLGVGIEYPIYGNCSFGHETEHPVNPFNKAVGTSRAALIEARRQNMLLGVHEFARPFGLAFDYRKWPSTTDTWQHYDLFKALRVGRAGELLGAGDAVRDEGVSEGSFYFQDTYTILSYNPSNRQVTVSPAFSQTYSHLRYVRILTTQAGVPNIAYSEFTLSGATSGTSIATLEVDPTDADRIVRNPTLGDTLVVVSIDAPNLCPHAIASSSYFDDVLKYAWGGMFEFFSPGTYYWDTETSRMLISASQANVPCVHDHADWGDLDSTYVAHPQGGGDWYVDSRRSLFIRMRDYLRTRSEERYGVSPVVVSSEFVDEQFSDVVDIDVQGMSSIAGFRGLDTAGVPSGEPDDYNFTESQYTLIPLFAAVYAGRVKSWGYNAFFSNGILSPATRNGDVVDQTFSDSYIRAMAFWIGNDWPFGLTMPVFCQYMDGDAAPTDYDLWNDDEYSADHPNGAANPEIAQVRDFWVSLVTAERTWASDYMRNGRMLAPLQLEANTTYTTSLHGATADAGAGAFVLNSYHNWPNIYPKDDYPAVTHGVWRHKTKSWVTVILSNWTHSTSVFDATYDFAAWGMTGRVSVFEIAPNGCPQLVDTFSTSSRRLETELLAYTTKALLIVPESETFEIQPRVTDLQVISTMVEGELLLTWVNPAAPTGTESKFVYPKVNEVIVVRRRDAYPTTLTDGQIVYRGTAETFTDTGLLPGVAYHYAVFVDDGGDLSTT